MFLFRKKDRKTHWEDIYRTHPPERHGWYQDSPDVSLSLIEATGVLDGGSIIDVGGGASRLIERLVETRCRLTVLDISSPALEEAKKKLGDRAARVAWVVADITRHTFAETFDLWHDRAVFHFLVNPEDRRAYVAALNSALGIGGHLVISTFGPEAPKKCAGLKVVRYSPESLHRELGGNFALEEVKEELHTTPGGTKQEFIYCRFRKTS